MVLRVAVGGFHQCYEFDSYILNAVHDFSILVRYTSTIGITPMIQALHAILGSQEGKRTKVTMLYGSKFADDILGGELLHRWAADYPDQLQVIEVLSDEPIEDSDWKGARGYIDKAMIESNFPKPSSSKFLIFVCGPPPMYNALCGAREEKEVKGLLGEIGYKPDQVYKF